jgi:hypothetical protein
MQSSDEVHDLSERGDFSPFEIGLPTNEFLFLHFVQHPTVGRYRRHWHSHLAVVVWRLSVFAFLHWSVPLFWIQRALRFSGSDRFLWIPSSVVGVLSCWYGSPKENIFPIIFWAACVNFVLLTLFGVLAFGISEHSLYGVVAMRNSHLVGN